MRQRDQLFYLASFALALLVLYPVWVPLATGLVLAYVCEGPANSILEHLGWRARRTRWLVAFACVSLVQILFIAPLFTLAFSAAQEVVSFWNRLAQTNLGAAQGLGSSELAAWLGNKADELIRRFDLPFSAADVTARLRGFIDPVLRVLASGLGRLLGRTPELILFLVLSWMSWVYFLAEGKEHRASLLPRLIPWPRQRHLLGHTLGEVLRQMVLASLALAILQSILVTISLGLAGVPKFLLWGAIAFFLSFVPVVGTFPVMGISALYTYLQGQTLAAALLLVAALAIGLSDNLLRPLLMRGSSEINFFWLFLSLLGGVAMFGLPGVILGPWFITLFLAVHREAQKHPGTHRA